MALCLTMNGFQTTAIALTFALTGCAAVTPDPMVVDAVAPAVSADVADVQREPAEIADSDRELAAAFAGGVCLAS